MGTGKTLWLLAAAQAALLPSVTALNTGVWVTGVLVAVCGVFGWSFMVPQRVRLASLDPPRTSVRFALNASAIYLGASLGSAVGASMLARSGLPSLGWGGSGLALTAAASLYAVKRLLASKKEV